MGIPGGGVISTLAAPAINVGWGCGGKGFLYSILICLIGSVHPQANKNIHKKLTVKYF
jgi:hypothetical protein